MMCREFFETCSGQEEDEEEDDVCLRFKQCVVLIVSCC